jgi:hypothetical protein
MFIFSFILISVCHAKETNEPPKIGNFALPPSQQPGPIIGFGQNILDKNQAQLFLFADDYLGVHKHFIDIIPAILYGITDNFSIFINVPVAESYRTDKHKSSGLEDAFIQLEYAFYTNTTTSFIDQATITSNITAPTGSVQKNPATGTGSPSFFIGATFNRTYVDWFFFTSPGITFTTAKNGTKFGNNYFYQFGLGKNITNLNGWMLAWMGEVDGTYAEQDRVRGMIDPNSGGNVIYVTPSLWASTKKFIFQLGAGYAAIQNLYGNQTRNTYLLSTNFGWTID